MLTALLCSALAITVATPAPRPGSVAMQAPVPVNDDAQSLVAFRHRIDHYVDLRRKVAEQLPKRSDKASPEEVVGQRQALASGIRDARAQARPGEIFSPEIQPLLRRVLTRVFKKPDGGASARQTVNEENPRGAKVAVNQPYPDGVPLTTMPPEVLTNLPPLPDGLQYHFVGRSLILMDADARLIVDYMPNAMP